jgi:hypothetical protein
MSKIPEMADDIDKNNLDLFILMAIINIPLTGK